MGRGFSDSMWDSMVPPEKRASEETKRLWDKVDVVEERPGELLGRLWLPRSRDSGIMCIRGGTGTLTADGKPTLRRAPEATARMLLARSRFLHPGGDENAGARGRAPAQLLG